MGGCVEGNIESPGCGLRCGRRVPEGREFVGKSENPSLGRGPGKMRFIWMLKKKKTAMGRMKGIRPKKGVPQFNICFLSW